MHTNPIDHAKVLEHYQRNYQDLVAAATACGGVVDMSDDFVPDTCIRVAQHQGDCYAVADRDYLVAKGIPIVELCESCDAPIGECELDCQQRRATWGD